MIDPKRDEIQEDPPERPSADVQAHASLPRASDPPRLREYDFRKPRSRRAELALKALSLHLARRWRLWLSLVLLVAAVGYYFLRPDPPLSAEEARQALVAFAAEDPSMAPYPNGYKTVPDHITWDYHNGTIYFGLYECDLGRKYFRFPVTHQRLSQGLCGRFVFESGVWKAKLGAPPNGEYKHWAG